MFSTILGKRGRNGDDDGGVEAEARARNARGRNPNTNFLPGDMYKVNEGQRHFPKCLLGLPDDVLGRIFSYVLVKDKPIIVTKNTMDLGEEVLKIVDKRGHTDNVPLERLALLGTCVRLREVACPIFYVGNDFTIAVQNFDTQASMAWWNKVNDIRQQEISAPSIRIITTQSNFTPRPQKFFRFGKQRKELWVQQYRDAITYGRDTESLTPGTVAFDIEYVPNWVNLKHWLHAYHEDRLPPYETTSPHPPAHLQGVAIAFRSIKIHLDKPWLEAARSLQTIRDNLIIQDAKWATTSVIAGKIVEVVDEAHETSNEGKGDEEKIAAGMATATLNDDRSTTPEALEASAEPAVPEDYNEPPATQYYDAEEDYPLPDSDDEDEDWNEDKDGNESEGEVDDENEGEDGHWSEQANVDESDNESVNQFKAIVESPASQAHRLQETIRSLYEEDRDDEDEVEEVEDDGEEKEDEAAADEDEGDTATHPDDDGTPTCATATASTGAAPSGSGYVRARESLGSFLYNLTGSGTAVDPLEVDDNDDEE